MGSNGDGGYPVIEVWKAHRKLQFRHNGTVREYRVVLGSQPRQTKQVQGDGRTPVGRYYISDKNPDSRFHRFLGISYPNVDDAERGYRQQLIGVEQWADIFLANLRGDAPPWHTVLGGRVGIHGLGGRPDVPVDWTQGCIAVSDEDIEFIFDNTPVGAPVIINE
jgi:murein L,D-transpeptidase YafK